MFSLFGFIQHSLSKPCICKGFHCSQLHILCIFPCFCPYEPKQGKVFILRRLLYPATLQYTLNPSAFESEIHPSHKSAICTPAISPWQGGRSEALLKRKASEKNSGSFSSRANKNTLGKSPLSESDNLDKNAVYGIEPYTTDYIESAHNRLKSPHIYFKNDILPKDEVSCLPAGDV